MALRAFAWRRLGSSAGRRFPALLRGHYEFVLSGLARALAHRAEVRAVLLHGSYGTERCELGQSDVDLVAVIDDLDPVAEVRLLGALRKPYRRARAVLPVDLCAIAAGQLDPAAGWLAFSRMQVGRDRPVRAVHDWRLVRGAECRVAAPWEPPGQLHYITEAEVSDAISAYASARSSPGRALALRLKALAGHCRREGLGWASAHTLIDRVGALLAGGGSVQRSARWPRRSVSWMSTAPVTRSRTNGGGSSAETSASSCPATNSVPTHAVC